MVTEGVLVVGVVVTGTVLPGVGAFGGGAGTVVAVTIGDVVVGTEPDPRDGIDGLGVGVVPRVLGPVGASGTSVVGVGCSVGSPAGAVVGTEPSTGGTVVIGPRGLASSTTSASFSGSGGTTILTDGTSSITDSIAIGAVVTDSNSAANAARRDAPSSESPSSADVVSAAVPMTPARGEWASAAAPRTIGTSVNHAMEPNAGERPSETDRNARTTAGSNCAPEQSTSSCRAAAADIGSL